MAQFGWLSDLLETMFASPFPLTGEQGKKNSLFSSLTAKADEYWGKGGVACVFAWEGWRKITQFLYSSFGSPLVEAKGGYWLLHACFRSVNCSWRTYVARCRSAKQLRGKICLILSCWKLNKIGPCPFACSLRKLWVRESHEPSVCTLYQLKIASVYIGLQTELHVHVHFF